MKFYTQFFDDVGSAFALRPERLRYIPVFIPIPPPQNPALSYGVKKENPFGKNGPPNLDYYLSTDNGQGGQCPNSRNSCGADTSAASDSSLACINGLWKTFGCTPNLVTTAEHPNIYTDSETDQAYDISGLTVGQLKTKMIQDSKNEDYCYKN